MDGMQLKQLYLHRHINVVNLCGVDCIMMPYYEDQGEIVQFVQDLEKERGTQWMKKAVGFGHLAINGAFRYSKDFKRYEGPTGTDAFKSLKRTFSGHFHVHQKLSNNFVYVGSPMQYNFGDAGTFLIFLSNIEGDDRGVVVYDVEDDKFVQVVSPFCHAFKKISNRELDWAEQHPEQFKDTFVMVKYVDSFTPQAHEQVKQRLLKLGVLDVKKESMISKAMSKTSIKATSHDLFELIEKFVSMVSRNIDKHLNLKQGKEWHSFLSFPKNRENLVEKGKEIVNQVKYVSTTSMDFGTPSNSEQAKEAAFVADISKVTIINFMGVQGTMEIDFDELPDGIWVLEGANGSGKSTLLEAITWAHFGEFLRSDMTKDFAINDYVIANHAQPAKAASKKGKKKAMDTGESSVMEEEVECKVRVEYANGFVVERSRKKGKPATLRTFQREAANGEEKEIYLHEMEKGELKNTQKVLEQKIGMNYHTFTKSVCLGQNIVSNFLNSGKDHRRDIIEETLGLEQFNQYFEEAKSKRSEIENEITANEQIIKQLKARFEELEQQSLKGLSADALAEDLRTKDASKKIITEQAQQQLQSLLDEEAQLHKQAEETQTLLSLASSKLQNHTQLRNVINALRKICSECVSDLKVFAPLLASNECPTCGQPVDSKKLQSISERIYQSLGNLQSQLALLDTQEEAVNSLVQSINAIVFHHQTQEVPVPQAVEQQLKNVLQVMENQIKGLESRMNAETQAFQSYQNTKHKMQHRLLEIQNYKLQNTSDKDRKLLMIDKQIATLETQLAHLNDHSTLKQEEMTKTQQQLDSYQTRQQQCNVEFQLYKFWETAFDKRSKANVGFASLRSFVLAESVQEINQIFRFYMEKLANDESWLSVTLTPDLELQEDYAKRSGGERKRSDLVTLFAMFELVRQRSQYQAQFIMLDEVFDALDKQGQSSVRGVLQLLAQSVKKVFVVTHTDLTHGMHVAGTMHFEMKKNPQGRPLGTSVKITRH